jgi:uncharacterized membrane protein
MEIIFLIKTSKISLYFNTVFQILLNQYLFLKYKSTNLQIIIKFYYLKGIFCFIFEKEFRCFDKKTMLLYF